MTFEEKVYYFIDETYVWKVFVVIGYISESEFWEIMERKLKEVWHDSI